MIIHNMLLGDGRVWKYARYFWRGIMINERCGRDLGLRERRKWVSRRGKGATVYL